MWTSTSLMKTADAPVKAAMISGVFEPATSPTSSLSEVTGSDVRAFSLNNLLQRQKTFKFIVWFYTWFALLNWFSFSIRFDTVSLAWSKQYAVLIIGVVQCIRTNMNVLWIRNCRNALRGLAGSRRTLLHMQQRAAGVRHGRQLESMKSSKIRLRQSTRI